MRCRKGRIFIASINWWRKMCGQSRSYYFPVFFFPLILAPGRGRFVFFGLFLVLRFGMCPETESKRTANLGNSGIIYDRRYSGLRDEDISRKCHAFTFIIFLSYNTHFNILAYITISTVPLQYYSVAEQVKYPLSPLWDRRAI
jgi:hypothetical protein